MNSFQREEIRARTEILELLANVYRHSKLLFKIRKAKKAKDYGTAVTYIHEVESEMKKKKHESFRKKLRKKFKKAKNIKRKKR
jgi:predicted ATP-dependent Lon-type protease